MADKKPPKQSAIDADLVRELAGLLEETGLSEIEYGTEDWHLRVAKGGTVPVPAPAPAPAPVLQETLHPQTEDETHADHPGVIVSPMVGTVYTAADADSAPFIKIGDKVAEGDTLLLIEAMKVFNPIKAARGGKVTRIFAENGTPCEFGEPLLIIE